LQGTSVTPNFLTDIYHRGSFGHKDLHLSELPDYLLVSDKFPNTLIDLLLALCYHRSDSQSDTDFKCQINGEFNNEFVGRI